MRSVNKIIVHCTATKAGKDYTAKDIDAWHKANGWNGIGYHYVVRIDGTVEAGRPEEEPGAHCSGHNKDSIGVVYVGGLDSNGYSKDTRTKKQKDALWDLLFLLHQKYPKAVIWGHNHYSNKACPCFDAHEEYYKISYGFLK